MAWAKRKQEFIRLRGYLKLVKKWNIPALTQYIGSKLLCSARVGSGMFNKSLQCLGKLIMYWMIMNIYVFTRIPVSNLLRWEILKYSLTTSNNSTYKETVHVIWVVYNVRGVRKFYIHQYQWHASMNHRKSAYIHFTGYNQFV